MKKYTIATFGGHSALEICLGARKHNFKTLVVVAKGRDKTYTKYFKNLIDEYIKVDKFSELTDKKVIEILQKKQSIFIPHRYLQVYCNLDKLEKNFPIPIFGNKYLLKYEERTGKYNQYLILDKANVLYPKHFKNPKDIDRLVLVKVKEAIRGYERAFFFARHFKDFESKSKEMIKAGKITERDLNDAVIEEYIVGVQVNFNFFYSPLRKSLELLGTDARRQTNIDGYIRLPAFIQQQIQKFVSPSYIETGHFAVTVKESLLETAFEAGEKIVEASKFISALGIIGPFAIQCAVSSGPPREKIIVYDLSFRIPGSPGTSFTPYSCYLFGRTVSFGERIAMEIKEAIDSNRIDKITT